MVKVVPNKFHDELDDVVCMKSKESSTLLEVKTSLHQL